MYDFKHQIHKKPYFNNNYKTFVISKSRIDIYQQIQNILVVVLIILALIIGSTFLFKTYQLYQMDKISTTLKVEPKAKEIQPIMSQEDKAKLALKEAITQSIVKNLQAQKKLKPMDDNELKHIITNVLRKIETAPQEIKYTQK